MFENGKALKSDICVLGQKHFYQYIEKSYEKATIEDLLRVKDFTQKKTLWIDVTQQTGSLVIYLDKATF